MKKIRDAQNEKSDFGKWASVQIAKNSEIFVFLVFFFFHQN